MNAAAVSFGAAGLCRKTWSIWDQCELMLLAAVTMVSISSRVMSVFDRPEPVP
ncbi:MAG: hypothetical protein WCC64_00230 [Aliidongia sp.]